MKYNSMSSLSLDRISTEELLAKLSPAGRLRFLEKLLQQDFSVFARKVFEAVSPGDKFLPNWHIDAMTYEAERIVEGRTKRLIVTVPPRHLKSIIFSVALPAFLLGRDPTARIICVSYSNSLAVNAIAVIGITPEGDKVTRAAKVSAQFEAGAVLFPKTAPWLSGLKAELLGFPNVKHDDQVDSVTQALSWLWQNRKKPVSWVAPIIVTAPRRYFGDPSENWWQGY
jgi:hypothetical protein